MTEERKQALREGRHAALEILRTRGAQPQFEPRPGERYDPFPLTDVQAAYILGRSDAFAYGGVACHGYAEFEFSSSGALRAPRVPTWTHAG